MKIFVLVAFFAVLHIEARPLGELLNDPEMTHLGQNLNEKVLELQEHDEDVATDTPEVPFSEPQEFPLPLRDAEQPTDGPESNEPGISIWTGVAVVILVLFVFICACIQCLRCFC